MSTLDMTLDKKPGWWRVPMVWLIIGLPLSAVIAGSITAVIAFSHQDAMVSGGVQKLGFATTQDRVLQERAAALGVAANLHVDHGRMSVTLSGPSQNWPSSLRLRLVHPTRADLDRQIELTAVGVAGQYAAQYAAVEAGHRQMLLEPAAGGWRLVGLWPSTDKAETRLDPGVQISTPSHLQR